MGDWMGAYAGINPSPAENQRVEHLSEALSASAAAMLTAREMITEMTALRLENGFLRERVALLQEEREALLTLVGKQQRHLQFQKRVQELQEQEKKA
jgi:regulator of replication initiation timing